MMADKPIVPLCSGKQGGALLGDVGKPTTLRSCQN